MKKIIITLAAMAMAVTSFAQVSVGVRAGGNLANMSDVYKDNIRKPVLGAYAGVLVDYSLSNVVSGLGVRGEVNFSMAGTAYKEDNYNYGNTRFNYLTIPVMAEFSIMDGALSLMAGPQIGINLGGSWKSTNGTDKTQINSSDKVSGDDMNGFEFGLAVGVTYMVLENVGVDVRYTAGMTNVFKETKLTNAFGKNNIISAGVVYKF